MDPKPKWGNGSGICRTQDRVKSGEMMHVKELIEALKEMPQHAEVVSAKDVNGAWTVLSKPSLTKHGRLDICVIKEGYP